MPGLISFRVRLGVLVTLAIAALPCFAGEVAVLRNGFSIRHERREVVGDVTRLYTTADGSSFVDVPTAEIEHFEAAPEVPASGARPAASVTPPFAKNAKDGVPSSPLFANNKANTALRFPARPQVDLNEVVHSASDRYRLDPDLVNSVIKAESGFNMRAVSPKGAQG